MKLFKDKVVIITGAGRGIGRAHALAFANEGSHVVVNDLGTSLDGMGHSNSVADKVVDEIKVFGGSAVANYSNIADLKGGREIVDTALENFGQIDVLINNAGILRDKSLLKMEESMWDQVIEVHLKGTFVCTQAVGRVFKTQGTGGRIINTTSISGILGNFGQTNYGAAKAGIIGFTKASAIELERYKVTVNAIAPLATTRMISPLVTDDMTPESVNPLVLFLASNMASNVTGRIFGVHGRKIFEYRMIFNEGVEKEKGGLWSPEEINKRFNEISSFK